MTRGTPGDDSGPRLRQVLFIQGGGEGTHDAWDNKLVDSLQHALVSGYSLLVRRQRPWDGLR